MISKCISSKFLMGMYICIVSLGLFSCSFDEEIYHSTVEVEVTYSDIYWDKNGIWIEEGEHLFIDKIEDVRYEGIAKRMYGVSVGFNGHTVYYIYDKPFFGAVNSCFIPVKDNSYMTMAFSVEQHDNQFVASYITEPIHVVPKGSLQKCTSYKVKYVLHPR